MVDTLDRQTHQIERGLRKIARHQIGCQALMTQFGVGELIALTFLSELGDASRLSSSRKAVRFAGLDIGVHRSDQTSRVGKLTRQGSSPLRWALYEAAQSATKHQSPDYAHYHALRASGMTHTRASLTIARKITKRSYHLLHDLGPNPPHRPPNRPSHAPCPPIDTNSRSAPRTSAAPTPGDPDTDRAAGASPAEGAHLPSLRASSTSLPADGLEIRAFQDSRRPHRNACRHVKARPLQQPTRR
jgi:hypothetical protein